MSMANPQETGASDVEYDIVSEFYHTLQGNENLTQYERDASSVGDQEAAQLFHQLREENKQRVGRIRGLLSKRIGSGGSGAKPTGF